MGRPGHRLRGDHRTAPAPEGLTDSKLLTVKRRTELAETLRSWVTSYALGHASPEEIDDLGMTAALRLAAVRALEGLPVRPDAVILDGKHDYLTARPGGSGRSSRATSPAWPWRRRRSSPRSSATK